MTQMNTDLENESPSKQAVALQEELYRNPYPQGHASELRIIDLHIKAALAKVMAQREMAYARLDRLYLAAIQDDGANGDELQSVLEFLAQSGRKHAYEDAEEDVPIAKAELLRMEEAELERRIRQCASELMERKLIDGLRLIAAERRRQIEAEGFSSLRDDQYSDGQLALAALAYLREVCGHEDAAESWPWDIETYKPGAPIMEFRQRNLIKAGALIAAELDRLARAAEGKR